MSRLSSVAGRSSRLGIREQASGSQPGVPASVSAPAPGLATGNEGDPGETLGYIFSGVTWVGSSARRWVGRPDGGELVDMLYVALCIDGWGGKDRVASGGYRDAFTYCVA
jgi:hypothetical protein